MPKPPTPMRHDMLAQSPGNSYAIEQLQGDKWVFRVRVDNRKEGGGPTIDMQEDAETQAQSLFMQEHLPTRVVKMTTQRLAVFADENFEPVRDDPTVGADIAARQFKKP